MGRSGGGADTMKGSGVAWKWGGEGLSGMEWGGVEWAGEVTAEPGVPIRT